MKHEKEILKPTDNTQKVSIDDGADTAQINPAPGGDNRPMECGDEATQLRAAVAELNDKYLRARAEIENTRRRAALDTDAAARSRAVAVAENFLPLVDAINAALAHDPANPGLIALGRAADGALSKTGITKIESIGHKMNPMFHNVVSTMPKEDKDTDIIVQELQTGYMFGDTVLRNSMVVVAK